MIFPDWGEQTAENSEQELPLLSKRQLAGRILDRVAPLLA